jgi:hypothetical protein
MIITVLPLVTVVKWGPGGCQIPSGETGSCLPSNECQYRGGIAGGTCAGGYGICCVFMGKSCNQFKISIYVKLNVFNISKLWWCCKREWNILCQSKSSRNNRYKLLFTM